MKTHVISCLFLGLISILSYANLPFEIEANHIKYQNKNKDLKAAGNVVVKYKTYTIYSEAAEYLRSKNELTFSKSTKIIDQQNNILKAKTIRLNLNSDVGYIKDGSIQTNKNIILKAQNIALKADKILISNCTLTTCTSQSPEWYLKSESMSINRNNNLINAEKNTLYFFNIPVFYIPSYSQSASNEKAGNRPTPEFGYNQIDKTYFNIYLGYLLTEEISGKAGVGISTERGFRYGASHIYTPNQNHSILLKTYNVEKTGFEGGIRYEWTKRYSEASKDPLLNALFIPTTNQELKTVLAISYMYDNANYYELYNALPELKYTISNINLFWDINANIVGSGGYYEDRITKDNRYQLNQNYEKELFNFEETFKIDNGFKLNTIYYTKNASSWNRLINYLSVSFPLLNTQSKITYSKLVHVNGTSPFVFDSINEVTEDELGIITNINLLPIILNIEGNYQLQSESFRSLKYTLSWVFQCWQIDFSVDTIWDEINLGVSVPLM